MHISTVPVPSPGAMEDPRGDMAWVNLGMYLPQLTTATIAAVSAERNQSSVTLWRSANKQVENHNNYKRVTWEGRWEVGAGAGEVQRSSRRMIYKCFRDCG